MTPKRGRPHKLVDVKLVARLAGIHCTTPEIAAATGVSEDTLERNYAGVLQKGRENGKASLRRIQWQLAKKGNAALAIWLGKQLLGQRDRHEHTGEDGGPVVLKHVIAFAAEPDDAARTDR